MKYRDCLVQAGEDRHDIGHVQHPLVLGDVFTQELFLNFSNFLFVVVIFIRFILGSFKVYLAPQPVCVKCLDCHI